MKTQRIPRSNLSQIAYNEIKEMILTGEREPGERTILDALSKSLNVRVTQIRDGLNKREQEDLVVITPRTSHSVVKIGGKDAHDIRYPHRDGIVSRVILRHADLSTTQGYPGKVADTEATRWIETLYG